MNHTYGFEKHAVWQEVHNFVKSICIMKKSFSKEEKYGLTDQLCRAAVSVSSNFAEGSSRTSSKDQSHFYQLAYSSLMEVLNQFILCFDLGDIVREDLLTMRASIGKISFQINQMRKSALSKPSQPSQSSEPSQQPQA